MDETRSRDSIRKAASDAMKAGGDIGRRVRDLTLESLAFILVGRVSDRALDSLFENSGVCAQFIVRKRLHRWLECIDLFDHRSDRLQKPLNAATENLR